MSGQVLDLSTWGRADQFRFFRTFGKPHYAVTSRIDVSHLMTRRKATGLSPYRACVFAIGAGVHAVPELRMRFRGDVVTIYDQIELSATVPLADGNFRYAYLPYLADFARFDQQMAEITAAVAAGGALNANSGERNDLAYLSCMPWLDYTSINNALPGPDDCIPRISWGKFVSTADGQWSMAMTIEVHHALVDGRQVGDYFAAVQQTLNSL
jgi:chloramphenicol O-acetyltransferase type A